MLIYSENSVSNGSLTSVLILIIYPQLLLYGLLLPKSKFIS